MDNVIQIENLVKDYGEGRGVFDIDLEVKRGEVFGFVGTNGSGKTTTIRNIMGFIKPTGGKVTVMGMDAWERSTEIKRMVSYVPGEISFPAMIRGTDFLKSQAAYLGIKDLAYMNRLIDALKLDPTANLSRMSKGMKQKTAIVAAMMGDEDILILDEPTTGLDPLMRDVFIDLLKGEKAKGKTIFMSSHIFEEVEEICDRVALIKDGHVIDVADMHNMGNKRITVYDVKLSEPGQAAFLKKAMEDTGRFSATERKDAVSVKADRADTKTFFEILKGFEIKSLTEEKNDLETYFNRVYKDGEK